MQNNFTTGLVCLIGYVHLLLTASHARITNRNPNTGLKFHWKNCKIKLLLFAQSTKITKDFFTHQVIRNFDRLLVIDTISCLLMLYPVTKTRAQATSSAVEKLIHFFGLPQSIVHGRGTAFIDTVFINCTKKWESPFHLKQHTRLGLVAKLKPNINPLPIIGRTF